MRHLLILALLLTNLPSVAEEQELALIGEGNATYLLFRVYEARLHAPPDTPQERLLDTEVPKRLTLEYKVAISRKDIEKAAWHVLQRQHPEDVLETLRPAVDQLHQAMQSVEPGQRYTLDYRRDGQLTLYFNDAAVTQFEDPVLAQVYFGIWLAEPPLSDRLRAQLTGAR